MRMYTIVTNSRVALGMLSESGAKVMRYAPDTYRVIPNDE